MTQRGVRGSLGRNLGRGCDAAGREKQFRDEAGEADVTQRSVRGT